MPDLLQHLEYRIVGEPTMCLTSSAAEAVLDEPTGSRNVVRKAAYEAAGWTYLFDPEMVVMMADEQLSAFARKHETNVFAWLCEGVSTSYGFRTFSPELQRDLLVVGGVITADVGQRLPEERDFDWARANEAVVLDLARRLGAPFDNFSTDRPYTIFTLDESAMPAVDLADLPVVEPMFRHDVTAKLVGRVGPAEKPWWKFW
jgi:hypothetical protein